MSNLSIGLKQAEIRLLRPARIETANDQGTGKYQTDGSRERDDDHVIVCVCPSCSALRRRLVAADPHDFAGSDSPVATESPVFRPIIDRLGKTFRHAATSRTAVE